MPSLSPHTGTLGLRLAKHLLRRATYKFTHTQLNQFAGLTASAAVDQLFSFDFTTVTLAEPIEPATGQPWINSGVDPVNSNGRLREYVVCWWMNEALNDSTIQAKMTFFLHHIWNIEANIRQSTELFDHLALLRYHAKGSYRDLALRMTLDNVMLDYLDGENNTKNAPNENYAREFLELFTIGKGPQVSANDYTNYTEQDIQTGALLLSGWRRGDRANSAHTDPVTGITRGRPQLNRHDTSDKTFSHRFNTQTITGATTEQDMWQELEDYVDMVFAQPETARHICRKLYRFFVHSNITAQIETDIIDPLATTLRNSNYSLETTVKQLLKSQHFFGTDDGDATNNTIGGMVRSPLEQTLHTLSFFQVPIPDPQTAGESHYNEFWRKSVRNVMLNFGGMIPFMPPSVAGYPAYYQEPSFHRDWFSSNTIISRYKLPEMLVKNKRLLAGGDLFGSGVAGFDIVDFVRNSGVIGNTLLPSAVVGDLLAFLMPEPYAHQLIASGPDSGEIDRTTSHPRYVYFYEVLMDDLPAFDWTDDWIGYLQTNDATAVRPPLEDLFKAILFSQEYQIA